MLLFNAAVVVRTPIKLQRQRDWNIWLATLCHGLLEVTLTNTLLTGLK